MFNHSEEDKPVIAVDETVKAYMLEMGRWTKFLAIFMFVIMALMILGGLSMMLLMPAMYAEQGAGSIAGGIFGGVFFLIYIVYVAVFFYPTWALLKYATTIKRALATFDQDLFRTALRYLKNYFLYTGILVIIIMAVYILGIAIIALTAAIAS